jgi:hypothetical protein
VKSILLRASIFIILTTCILIAVPAQDAGTQSEEEPATAAASAETATEPASEPAEEATVEPETEPADGEPVSEEPVSEEADPADEPVSESITPSADMTADEASVKAQAAEYAAAVGTDNEAEPEVDEKPPRVDEFRTVIGLEQWRYEYDISAYQPGKYNMIIQGRDKAGNIYTEGPYNIVIDPESDLPITNISNPAPNMRVGGNLNIVGTCVDDDAVALVEISINDGPFFEATGTEFWSYELSTFEMLDGAYKITSRGTDIHGVVGRGASVMFHLDRYNPAFEITSHENGDLVSGRIDLTGVVSDLNGIASLSYSSDNGETFEDLQFRGNKQALSVEFSVRIDTTELEDGPQVYRIRGRDRTGSEDQTAFLLFVDNKPPEISILYPTEDQSVNGVFTVSGMTNDDVGLSQLTWTIGKDEPVDIPISPGDPYWIQEFDFTGQTEADITFTLTDKAGNSVGQRLKLALAADEDLPEVTIVYPEAGGRAEIDRLAGFLRDDDGVLGIVYAIDDGLERTVETGQSFDIQLPELPSGTHVIDIAAIDINEVRGVPTIIEYTRVAAPPVIEVSALVDSNDQTVDFYNGMDIQTDLHTALVGTITFGNPIGTATYSFAGGESQPLSLTKSDDDSVMDFSLPLPKADIPYGFIDLLIESSDGYELLGDRRAYLFAKNLARNQEDHGIYFSDIRLSDGNTVLVKRDDPFVGRYVGYSVDSIVLEPPTEVVTVRQNGGVVEVRAGRDGLTEATEIRITTDRGTVFTAGPFFFATDTTPPRIELDPSIGDGQADGLLRLRGTVRDSVGGVTMSYSIGDDQRPLAVSGPGTSVTFDRTIAVTDLSEEGHLITVVATDSSGNKEREYIVANRTPEYKAPDPKPDDYKDPFPVVQAVTPTPGQIVFPSDLRGGKFFAGGVASGVVRIDKVFYSLDRGEDVSIAGAETFELELSDLEPGAHTILFKAISDKGISGTSERVEFEVAPPAPFTKIAGVRTGDDAAAMRPGMDIAVDSETILTGTVSESVVDALFSIDGGEDTKLKISENESGPREFSIPIDAIQGYGRHEVVVTVTDGFERTDVFRSFYYRVEPRGTRPVDDREGLYVADERFGGHQSKIILARGDTVPVHFHGRQITNVRANPENDLIRVDIQGNLLSFEAIADGTVEGFTISVTTIDGDEFGTTPESFIIDGEGPVIHFEDHLSGQWVRDTIPLVGSVTDNLGIAELSVSIGGQVVLSPVIPSGDGTQGTTEIPFDIEMPLASLPDGDLTVRLLAIDSAGNESVKEYLVKKDNTPPTVVQIGPDPATPVNGRFTMSALALDNGNIDRVEFSGDGYNFEPVTGTSLFSGVMSMARYAVTVGYQVFRITDQSGNETRFVPELDLDPESDIPVVEIQIPEDGALIRNDFILSGMVFDDDEVKRISYRIDGGPYQPLEAANNFEIEFKLDDLKDNRHTVEVRAEDLARVQSEVTSMWFNVSKTEPLSVLAAPSIAETVNGTVELVGRSSDENGIDSVFVSFDNGNTFNRAEGGEEWSYSLDTRTLPDGTYSLLIRAVDSFGVDGLYTTLLNIDNTVPTLELSGFLDREPFADVLNVRGRITDSIGIDSVQIDVLPIVEDEESMSAIAGASGKEVGDEDTTEDQAADEPTDTEGVVGEITPFMTIVVPPDEVLLHSIDLTSLPPGVYNLQVTAKDRAQNTGYVSRNFEKIASVQISSIDIMFPAQGEKLSGEFSLQGHIETPIPPDKAALFVDGELHGTLEVNSYGYYAMAVTPEDLDDGSHELHVEATLADGEVLRTDSRTIEYTKTGPWIVIDNFSAGAFASQRPWIEGRAGYTSDEIPEDDAEVKAFMKTLEVIRVELSIDNGKTFQEAQGEEEWRFRVETQNIQDGLVNLMVRARFRDNSTAVTKTQLIVDETPPQVTLLSPEEGMSFNDSIFLSGTAWDANGLVDVSVALRKGDKAQYDVPTFIQGLFIDFHGFGGTYWEAGLGLTFFDDNVKLEVFLGNSPPGRFSGTVFGAKLLANIAVLPYGFFFGPDWNFLSSSVAIGANFAYFNMAEGQDIEAEGLVLAAVIGQIELARFEIEKWKVFNAFSLYVEGQLWFISSDIEGGALFKLAFGLRSEVF